VRRLDVREGRQEMGRSIVKTLKTFRKMLWVGHVSYVGKISNTKCNKDASVKYFIQNLKGKTKVKMLLGNIGAGGKILQEPDLEETHV
jgi:hypothetical protein